MPTAVIMPQLGESVVEGTVNRWLKAEGETVDKLEPLLEIATDKIDTEVPAPIGGVLLTVLVAEGRTVDAGTVLGYIGEAGETVAPGADTDQNQADVSASEVSPKADPTPPPPNPETAQPADRSFISPVVARLAAEHRRRSGRCPGHRPQWTDHQEGRVEAFRRSKVKERRSECRCLE